jgi:predicted TIM-barrel fold metal-dependent hydrolase
MIGEWRTMATIDADAHVIETTKTFEFMDEADKAFAPVVLTQTEGVARQAKDGGLHKEHWLVGSRVLARDSNLNSKTPRESREMSDVESRLRHMDELKIDVQVLYPTIFLRPVTQKKNISVALALSYNRWLAGIWKAGRGRLRWVAVPPLLDMAMVPDELRYAKDHGACGVFLNGLECERQLSDPYFFPLYEVAEQLDLPICIHSGINCTWIHDFFEDVPFSQFKLSVLSAFHCLAFNDIPAMFPDLRWAFVEASAQWIPYLLNDLAVRFRRRGKPFPENLLKQYNMYVTCQVSDDLPMILPYSGEDNLMIGTDYGHSDSSAEIEALRLLKDGNQVPAAVVDKILGANPCRFYGLKDIP